MLPIGKTCCSEHAREKHKLVIQRMLVYVKSISINACVNRPELVFPRMLPIGKTCGSECARESNILASNYSGNQSYQPYFGIIIMHAVCR